MPCAKTMVAARVIEGIKMLPVLLHYGIEMLQAGVLFV